MNELSTFRWTFDEDIERYAAAGYQSIGVWQRKLVDLDEKQALQAVAQSGLSVSSLMWAGGFTGSGGMGFQDAVDEAMEAMRLAAALGADCLVVYSGGRNNHILSQAWRLFHDAIGKLLPLAEVLDVKLALEPMHPASAGDWTFITSVSAALDAIQQYNDPHLQVAVDLYHFGTDSPTIDLALAHVDKIALIQLADRKRDPREDQDRCLLGEGRIPVPQIVHQFEAAGYNGSYEVKLLGPEIVPDQYGRVLSESQSAVLPYLTSTA